MLDASNIPGGAEGVMQRLRGSRPPVVARVEDEKVLFDPRTVGPDEDEDLLSCLQRIVS